MFLTFVACSLHVCYIELYEHRILDGFKRGKSGGILGPGVMDHWLIAQTPRH